MPNKKTMKKVRFGDLKIGSYFKLRINSKRIYQKSGCLDSQLIKGSKCGMVNMGFHGKIVIPIKVKIVEEE